MTHGRSLILTSAAARGRRDRSAGRHLAGRAQPLQERQQGVDLGGREVLPLSRHVASALQDLPDQLIPRQAGADAVERGAPLAALTGEAVAVAALLVLEHERALQLERRPPRDVLNRRRTT